MLSHANLQSRIPTGFCGIGSTPVSRRGIVCSRRVAGGRCAGVGRDDGLHQSLASGLARQGAARSEGGRPGRPQAPPGAGRLGEDRAGVAGGAAGARVRHRRVDLAARGRNDRAPHRRRPSPGPCVARAAGLGLVAPTARPARARTRRDGDRPVEACAVGAAKKTPSGSAPGSSSRTKAVSRSNPSSVARGRRAAKPRS